MKNFFLNCLYGLSQGWWEAGVIILLFIVIIIAAGKVLDGRDPFHINGKFDRTERSFLKSFFFTYFLYGMIQQIGLVVVYELFSLIPRFAEPGIIVTVALIFAFLHFPNFLLMFATFGFGQVTLWHWSYNMNIIAIGMMHGMIATTLEYYPPDWISTKFGAWKKYTKYQKEGKD